MDINVSQVYDRVPVTVLEISGMINLGTARELEKRAMEEYEEGMRYLLLDLEGVDSLSSAGLRSVLSIGKMLSQESEKVEGKSPYLKILDPQAQIKRVLEIAGFDGLFEIYDDREEALASF